MSATLGHRRRVADLRPGELDATPQRVHVTVAEGRQQGAAVEVDDLAGVVGERERVEVERDDAPAVDRDRPRPRRDPSSPPCATVPPCSTRSTPRHRRLGQASMLDMTCLIRV